MKLALTLSYSGAQMSLDMERILEVERLGFDSVWSAESYGSDAVTPAAWIAARTARIHVGTGIMQLAARSPAATAMTAMTLDGLSGGRFRLGLGVSGPQVVEGWHGQPFGKPLARTREYVAIVRRVLRREKPLEFRGEYYQIPYAGPDATGLGKPLKSILHGRPDLPIYLAAIGPRNTALAAEIADGWIPTFFSARRIKMFREWLDAGVRPRGGAPPGGGALPLGPRGVGGGGAAGRDPGEAQGSPYRGGVGARGRNFYNDVARRYGYEEAARTIQDLYLEGRKAEAETAVPDALVDEVALCGPRERIRERLGGGSASGGTTLPIARDGLAAPAMAAVAL